MRVGRSMRWVLGAVGPLALGGCGQSEPELPLGTMQLMMAEHVQPTSEVFWGAVRFESVLNDDGTVTERDIKPQNDAEWQRIEAAATRLVELGELLKTPAYAEGRGEDWMAFSQGMIDVSKQAEQAAQAQDPDAVFEVGGTLYNVCQACHQIYPPEAMPEGVEESDLRPTQEETLEEYRADEGGAR